MSLIFLELFLFFGVVFAWGFYELYTLRRDRQVCDDSQQALDDEVSDG